MHIFKIKWWSRLIDLFTCSISSSSSVCPSLCLGGLFPSVSVLLIHGRAAGADMTVRLVALKHKSYWLLSPCVCVLSVLTSAVCCLSPLWVTSPNSPETSAAAGGQTGSGRLQTENKNWVYLVCPFLVLSGKFLCCKHNKIAETHIWVLCRILRNLAIIFIVMCSCLGFNFGRNVLHYHFNLITVMTASQLETGNIILIEKHNFNRKEENNFIFHVCMKEKQPWTSCMCVCLTAATWQRSTPRPQVRVPVIVYECR